MAGPRPVLRRLRRRALRRAHRPQRHRRHRGPQQRPAQRLRRGVRRLVAGRRARPRHRPARRRGGLAAVERLDADVRAGLALAADDPAALARPRRRRPRARPHDRRRRGARRARAARRRRAPRHRRRRRHLRRDRNINFTNVCYTGCRFCAFAQRRTDADAFTLSLDEVGQRVADAWDVGATEICMQGGIHPDLPGTAYFDLARAVKKHAPDIHLHAFSPMEVVNGATRIRDVRAGVADRGQGRRPRLHPGHSRRDPRRRRPLGAHQGQAPHRAPGSTSSPPRTTSASRRPRR